MNAKLLIRRRAGLTVAGVVMVMVGVMWWGGVRAEGEIPVGVVVEGPAAVGVGQVITLTLRLQAGSAPLEVGGLEAEVRYDPAVAEWAGFAPALAGDAADGTGSDGASVERLTAVQVANGSAFGYYRCVTAPCRERAAVQAAAAVSGAAAVEAGVLAQVELLGLAAGPLEIEVGNLQVVDRAGRPLAVQLVAPRLIVQVGEGGAGHGAPASMRSAGVGVAGVAEVAVIDAAAADVTTDGVVTHGDVMEVALAWESARAGGDACGGTEPGADANGDGCVDILDVQGVAAQAGQRVGEGVRPQLSPRMFLPLLLGPLGGVGVAGVQTVYTVNSTGDEIDRFLSDNKCLTVTGVCTLRAAIQQANAHAGPDVIRFALSGSGVQKIQIGSRFQALLDTSGGTTIDGYSQPGSAANTDAVVSNAQILVEVRGNGAEAYDGLPITSAGNVVKGLALYNFRRALWVYGAGAHNNVIEGDFIGTDAAGGFEAGAISQQQAHGVHIEQGAHDNQVGGTQPAQRNVIAGNARSGVGIWHVGTNGNQVLNNLVGLTPDGLHRRQNRLHGVDMNYGAAHTVVGGFDPGERNLISGNSGKGVEVSHEGTTTDNHILGNYIGTDASGDAAPAFTANGQIGVSLKDRVTNNVVMGNVIGNSGQGGVAIDDFGNCCVTGTIVEGNRIGIGVNGGDIANQVAGVRVLAGRSRIGPDNLIANNPVGIQIEGDASDGNTITENSIFANLALGIDLAPLGQANANDPDDADGGPNQQLNYPVLATATITQVTGTACITCTVEIFIADGGADAFGEGRNPVGNGSVAADGTFVIAVDGPQQGDFVTATATDAEGNTSEFAQNLFIAGLTVPGFPIPGRIEAEDYQTGGEGVGYHDTTSGNTGGAYRNDDVDIQATLDTTGTFNVGWIAASEWLAYDVNIQTSGTYLIVARVAAASGPRRFHFELDGANISGTVTIAATGGMQKWADVSIIRPLTSGHHTLRFVAETLGFNVNYFNFALQ